MRRLAILAIAVSGIWLGVRATTVHAQRDYDTGVTVYADFEYRGVNFTFRRDVPDLRAFGFNNQISSLRVPPGERWEICEGRDFSGRCSVVTGDIPNLARFGWNNTISSIHRLQGAGPVFVLPSGNLELFAGPDFTGHRLLLTAPAPDFRRLNFNDRAMSLHTFRGEQWEVCVNIDYDDCRVVEGDTPNLTRLGLERGISSARPRGGRLPLPPIRANGLELFAGTDFSGERMVLTSASQDLKPRNFNDRTLSLRVPPGQRWEVCVDAGFRNCQVVERDQRDLSGIGLGHNISSARPVR